MPKKKKEYCFSDIWNDFESLNSNPHVPRAVSRVGTWAHPASWGSS